MRKRNDANLCDDVERHLGVRSIRRFLFNDGDLSERVDVQIVQKIDVER